LRERSAIEGQGIAVGGRPGDTAASIFAIRTATGCS
jgi:hypothetical protein